MPRLHYWMVSCNGQRYFLRRFHDWFSEDAILWMHSVMGHLVSHRLPVPRIVSAPGKKDGLYWPTTQSGGESPLGELE